MTPFDAIIIGFGKGGKTLAAKLASSGKQVAVVEKSDKMYGGTCINVGCIPSKSLVHSAAFSALRTEIDFEKKAELYRHAIEEKRKLTTMLRTKNFDKLNDNKNITIFNGVASFENQTTVKVDLGEKTILLSAEKIYINTGSASVRPKIKGIENNPFIYYSDTLMELDQLPRQLTIIGGGYIGLEFASMYANFGSNVTVLQDSDKFIPREDDDIAEAMKKLLEEQGITFRLGCTIKGVQADGSVCYDWNKTAYHEKADAILVATGRKPNINELNLSAANIHVTERGAIAVNEDMQTSQPGIYAMGDVTGGLQFTYISLDDFRIIASKIEGRDYSVKKRKNVPYSVFMATPLSRVGLNEKEAAASGLHYRVVKLPVTAIPKAQVLKKPIGILKALIDTDTNKILGAMLLCEESYEMINIVKLAMDLEADYTVLRDQIFTHPTMSEALNDLFSL